MKHIIDIYILSSFLPKRAYLTIFQATKLVSPNMVNKPFTKRIQNQKCFIYKVLNGPMRSQLHLFVKGRITLRASPSQKKKKKGCFSLCIQGGFDRGVIIVLDSLYYYVFVLYIFENIVVQIFMKYLDATKAKSIDHSMLPIISSNFD